MKQSSAGLNTNTKMGDLELAVIARDGNMIPDGSTLDLSSITSDLNLAPIPWNDPMFYLSITILVAFTFQIIYNLYTRHDHDQH